MAIFDSYVSLPESALYTKHLRRVEHVVSLTVALRVRDFRRRHRASSGLKQSARHILASKAIGLMVCMYHPGPSIEPHRLLF